MKKHASMSLLFFAVTIFFSQALYSEPEGGCSIKVVKPCDGKDNPDVKKDTDPKKVGKKEGKNQK